MQSRLYGGEMVRNRRRLHDLPSTVLEIRRRSNDREIGVCILRRGSGSSAADCSTSYDSFVISIIRLNIHDAFATVDKMFLTKTEYDHGLMIFVVFSMCVGLIDWLAGYPRHL